MLKKLSTLAIGLAAMSIVSCSENDGVIKEYDNWQKRNDEYFLKVYSDAKSKIDAGAEDWRIIMKYGLDESSKPTDHIVVKVLASGEEERPPLATDTVNVHYRGNLMPSNSYANGYQFDSSWTGEYNLATMKPYKSVCGAFIDGFTTALLNMHSGDHWLVYIPYDLGYGSTTSSSSTIPAYSTLCFDMTLQSHWAPKLKE